MGTPEEGNAAVIYTNISEGTDNIQASEYSSVLGCYIMLTGNSYSSLEQHGASEVLVLICQPT